jgi:hypothetical protein
VALHEGGVRERLAMYALERVADDGLKEDVLDGAKHPVLEVAGLAPALDQRLQRLQHFPQRTAPRPHHDHGRATHPHLVLRIGEALHQTHGQVAEALAALDVPVGAAQQGGVRCVTRGGQGRVAVAHAVLRHGEDQQPPPRGIGEGRGSGGAHQDAQDRGLVRVGEHGQVLQRLEAVLVHDELRAQGLLVRSHGLGLVR